MPSNFEGWTSDWAGDERGDEGGNDGGDEGGNDGGDEGPFGINALKFFSACDKEKEVLGLVLAGGGGTGISGIPNIFFTAGCLTAVQFYYTSKRLWKKNYHLAILKVKFVIQ